MQNLFYYPIVVEELSLQEKRINIKANEDDLKFIAEVLKIPEVKSFQSVIMLKYDKKNSKLNVWGEVHTALVLQSVISLENFDKKYDTNFELLYDTKATLKSLKEKDFDFDDDIPDIIIDGQIDLGEISIEQVALLMDDYPKKDGEVFEVYSEFDPEDKPQKNPFEMLKSLKK